MTPYLTIFLALLFSCSSISGTPSLHDSFKKPNPFSQGWWVCAYCGKKYENGETSCPCH